jgi:transposase
LAANGAPILFHGLSQLGLPVVCVESRQAYQALSRIIARKKLVGQRVTL